MYVRHRSTSLCSLLGGSGDERRAPLFAVAFQATSVGIWDRERDLIEQFRRRYRLTSTRWDALPPSRISRADRRRTD